MDFYLMEGASQHVQKILFKVGEFVNAETIARPAAMMKLRMKQYVLNVLSQLYLLMMIQIASLVLIVQRENLQTQYRKDVMQLAQFLTNLRTM